MQRNRLPHEVELIITRLQDISSRVSQILRMNPIRWWWRRYSDWRLVLTLIILAGFTTMVVMPTGVALAFHRGKPVPNSVQAWLNSSDEQTTIYVYRVHTGDTVAMPLGEYLIDVLAAELPPNAPPAALEAAAVAARTYAVQAMLAKRSGVVAPGAIRPAITTLIHSGTANATSNTSNAPSKTSKASSNTMASSHTSNVTSNTSKTASNTSKTTHSGTSKTGSASPSNNASQAAGADVTDSGQFDLPMETAAAQDARWGNQVDEMRSKYQAAILATDGLIVSYKSLPILAFSFPLSPGVTRSAQEVFHKSIPYLQAVPAPDDKAVAKQPTQSFTVQDLASRLGFSSKNAKVTQFSVTKRLPDGFVVGVQGPGGVNWTGSTFEKKLGLPSSDFTLKAVKDKLVIESYGIGADVGLSLHEATALATQGVAWRKILATFYPGTGLMSDVGFPLTSFQQ